MAMPCQWSSVQTLLNEESKSCATTWENMVFPDLAGTERACVLCGKISITGKSVLAEEILDLFERNEDALLDMQAANYNVICSAFQYQSERNMYPETVWLCRSCHHWLSRRMESNKFVSPLLKMRCVTLTLHNVEDKAFDNRVLQRICRSLVQKTDNKINYYSTLLSNNEFSLCYSIGHSLRKDISTKLAKYHYETNNKSEFLHCKIAAEAVRQAMT